MAVGGYGNVVKLTGATTGSLEHENGSVGVGVVDIPSVAGAVIASVLIENTHSTNNLLVSFDAGVTFKTLEPDDVLCGKLRGALTQFKIKGSAASTTYEMILSLE